MINFFRRLRKSVVGSVSIRKYSFYALGEVFLVMVGILLALQVNNWNEERKNRKFEKNILAEIRNNLELDAAELSDIVDSRSSAVMAIDEILQAEQKNDLLDELPVLLSDIISHDRFFAVTNAYEVLKSKGLDIIQNDSLKLDLGRYYDNYANEIQLHNRDIEDAFFKWTEILEGEIEDIEWKVRVVLRDPEKILTNPNTMSFLKLQKSNHFGTGEQNREMLDLNIRIKNRIDSELQDI